MLGFLKVDQSRHGALTLTEESRPLLRGETAVQLRVDPKEQRASRRARPLAPADALEDADRILWDALRECRRQIAAEHRVPPYVIFHDSTLLQMVEAKPGTEEDLLQLSGIGRTKLEKYGLDFLMVVRDYRS